MRRTKWMKNGVSGEGGAKWMNNWMVSLEASGK